MLSRAECRAYARDGFLFPRRALEPAEAAVCTARVATHLDRFGDAARGAGPKTKRPHLLLPWVANLARTPAILDPVADIVGPDILLWFSAFFIKEAASDRFISWHQDTEYAVSSPRAVSAWLALTPANPENGGLRFQPGSHRQQLAHEERKHPDNLLTRGQTIGSLDEDAGIDVVLKAGEFALFHGNMAHASAPNGSSSDRIGLVFRYVPGDEYEIQPNYDSATCLRGRDLAGRFRPEPTPRTDLDPAAMAFHAQLHPA